MLCWLYRDPNVQQTLDRFAAGAVWAANGEFTDRDIDEAKLSVFSQVTIIITLPIDWSLCACVFSELTQLSD